jgi:hypothetical protein
MAHLTGRILSLVVGRSVSRVTPMRECPCQMREVIGVADKKARQSAKIRQIGETLIADGYRGLDEKAKVLRLPQSTTWTILRATHKTSGLSVSIINRMLASPGLPPRVRLKIHEYIEEKSGGVYGDARQFVRKYTAHLERASLSHRRSIQSPFA